MSDIVEQLEAWIRPAGANMDLPFYREAIDAIKQLRADVKLWRERVEEGARIIEANVTEIERLRDDSKMLSLCEGDRKWMAAENARLRATLREDRKYLAGLCGCAASSGCGAAIRRAEIDRLLSGA